MALTTIDDRGLKTPIDLLDNEKIRFGTGNDLEIYHSSSHSYIKDAGTGKLRILSNEVVLGNAADTESLATFIEDGAVNLYYDGSKKINTSAAGINLDNSGGTTGYGKITFGNSGQQYIEAKDSGNFGSGAYVTIGSGTDVAIKAKHDNAVELYYDNSKKFETRSGGVTVTGQITASGSYSAGDSSKYMAGDGDDLQIYHNGSNSYLQHSGAGDLYVQTAQTDEDLFLIGGSSVFIKPTGGADHGIKVQKNGAVELYYDGSKKFETTSGGVETQGEFHFKAPNSTTGEQVGRLEWWNENDAGVMAKIAVDRTAGSLAPGDLVFSTSANVDTTANGGDGDITERLRIDSSGALGLGITPKDNDGNYRQLQIGLGAHFYGRTDDTPVYISSNGYRDGNAWKYTANTTASRIAMASNFTFKTAVSGTADNAISWSERMTIFNTGDVQLHAGNLKLASGKGIDFSATSDATGKTSELLDDYEEGTWTPTIYFTSGGNTATYTSNTGGWYVKVGRLVTLNGRIAISAKGSGSNAVYFGGLPFTVGNHNSGTSGVEGGLTISYLSDVNADKGSGIIGGYANESTTQAIPFYVDTSNNFHYVEDFDLEATANIGFTITYCV